MTDKEFLISRVSAYDESPHDKAYKITYDRKEVRTLKTEKEFDRKFGDREGLWRSKGVHHIINEEGYIQRTHLNKNEGWAIKFSSLEELIEFSEENGSLVFTASSSSSCLSEIEIYDGWRE